ncbi:MAG: hydantoinase/oxoprolinase family protein, partial [Candidatus Bathyarchaeia archaeon]
KGVFNAFEDIKLNVRQVNILIHGTTVALNCIINRSGSKTAFITTKGFRDILEYGFERPIKELYNFLWKKPPPIVPRHLRFGVSERINRNGKIIMPINMAEIREIIKELEVRRIEAVAICLLHSYINPEHENIIANLIKELLPDVYVSPSHKITREYGEFKRAYTTVLNAYIAKIVNAYIEKLEEKLRRAGFLGKTFIVGPEGVLDTHIVKDKPIFIVSSGPIGGVAGATYIASELGLKDAIAMDIGGTSCDIALIKDGSPIRQREYEIAGYPILLPSIEVHSIGAGGGSIAWVDEGGLLHVGPQSAGANPGPMCYDKGGKEPTVTDAAVVAGFLDPNYFLGGRIPLKKDLAEKGVRSIANRLGINLYEAADGILTIAKNNIVNAMSKVLIGKGYDPRDFTLISYGGAGGLFASDIAKDLSIPKVVIPPNPAVFSAWGLLNMDITYTVTRSYIKSLNEVDEADIINVFSEMEIEGKNLLREEQIEVLRFLDMCYEGQGHYIEVPLFHTVKIGTLKQDIMESFNKVYKSIYGYTLNFPLKIINLRVRFVKRIKKVPLRKSENLTANIQKEALKGKRNIFYKGMNVEFHIYERDKLMPGNLIRGPAIIEEPFHTTVVLPDQNLYVDNYCNLIIKVM